MSDARRSLTEELTAVLQEHIAGGGEAALLRAYDLGREAVTDRLNFLEMLAMQQAALVALLLQRLGTDEGARLTQAAAEVFTESLAPFELARRSSQEGNALLRHLNEELERQVAERTEELRRSVERLAALQTIDRAILAAKSTEDIAQVGLRHLRVLIQCERASVHVFDVAGHEVTPLVVDVAGEAGTGGGRRVSIEAHGEVEELSRDQVYMEEDLSARSQLPPFLQHLLANGVRSYLRIPLSAQGTVIGIMYLSRYRNGPFSRPQIAIAEEVADQIAIALQQARLREQVQHHAAELQRQRDFAESLIETARVIVLLLDPDGRILRFNHYMEKLSGYRLAEVQGKSWFATFIPERNRSRVQEMFVEAVHGAQAYYGVNAIVTRDRREREIEWSSTTLTDATGNLIGLLCIGQDITERQRAQTLLQNLVQTAQDAIVSIDQRGRIELFNPAAEQIFGYTRAEAVGQNVNMLMPEPYASEHDEYIRRAQRTGEFRALGRTRVIAARRKTGEVFPIELSLAKIAMGEEVTYGAFIRDISEKVRLQEQLLERERLAAIGTTAATFAHEVGNPLNSMYMSAQLLERRLARQQGEVDERALVSLRNLMGEIRRLVSLLDEFRTLARRQKVNLQSVSLTAVVEDVLAVESLSYKAQGITIERSLPADLPLVQVDTEKMKQVVLNLCKNAAEAMPEGGKLSVSVSHAGDQVSLEISDTGGGIPAGVDIFEPFITTKPKGTGLGLTIVRQIIAAHDGTLTYHSTPAQGTTFTITLPVPRQVQT
jgi:two-component system sensor kinase FixL